MSQKLWESIRQHKIIVMDFDGVMTDNRVLVNQDGVEAVFCNRGDGLGIDMLREAGFQMLILSTETNKVVQARAEKLKIALIHGTSDKLATLNEYCQDKEWVMKDICYIGNDLNDFEVMSAVGYKIAPADAHSAVLEIADFTSAARGGEGVVRELAERILNG